MQRTLRNKLGLVLGPVLAALTYWSMSPGGDGSASFSMAAVAAVTAWMAVWWITEAVPLGATALLPLVLLPAFRVQTTAEVATAYAGDLIFLFLGGFLVALAIEESGLHRRVALGIVAAMGDHPRRIVFGFMLATAALSMWLSNSATTMMLLPIAVSVLIHADSRGGRAHQNFGVALMLGIAYGASIGGVATIVGTPPNAYFRNEFAKEFVVRGAPDFSFGGWMLMALPMAALFLAVAWWLLTRFLFPIKPGPLFGGSDVIRDELRSLGPMSRDEWVMAGIFATTAALWILREPVTGWGWAPMLGVGRETIDGASRVWLSDGAVAIAMGLVCFIAPSTARPGRGILEWRATARMPWEVLLLFGGGMALAASMKASGFATYAGGALADALRNLPAVAQVALCGGTMTAATEMTSNLASVQISLPILKEAALANGRDPRLLMLPTTLAASWAFMLPVATPPNAIVYGSGRVAIRDMIKAGFVMNALGIVLILVATFALAVPIFDIQTTGAPEWSNLSADSTESPFDSQ
ncbi:MAG: anion permease [Pirellulales bacterium]|nr:anion permease [Pirellulales bacterium]